MTRSRGTLLSTRPPLRRNAIRRFGTHLVNVVQASALRSFTRETSFLMRPSAGGECATELDAPPSWSLLPNCRQHLGVGRHPRRIPAGGAMQQG